MKPLVKSLVATVWACMLVSGCGRTPGPASPDLGGPSGIITWSSSAGKGDPLPGIDQGSVYHLGTAFVLWIDAPGGGGGSSSSDVQGVTIRSPWALPSKLCRSATCSGVENVIWLVPPVI